MHHRPSFPSFRSLLLASLILTAALCRAVAQDLTFSILAGTRPGAGWVDGLGSEARFSVPGGLASDVAGNVYVADIGNAVVRKITPAGVVSTLPLTISGSAIAVDQVGNVYAVGANGGSLLELSRDGTVLTLAGGAQASDVDGTGSGAHFANITGIALDDIGNVYVTDATYTTSPGPGGLRFAANTIRKITPSGVVTTLAGTAGTTGSTDGDGAAVRFARPAAITRSPDGNLYVLDTSNGAIRKVTLGGTVTTFATASQLFGAIGLQAGPSGALYTCNSTDAAVYAVGRDALIGRFATLKAGAAAIAVDSAERVFVAVSTALLQVGPSTQNIIAGYDGSSRQLDGWSRNASFASATGFAVDSAHNVYVLDRASDTSPVNIRKITPAGVVTTVASFALARGSINRMTADAAGTVYFTAGQAVYRVTNTGNVAIVAGDPISPGYVDGPGATARFWVPSGLVVDTSSTIYVAEEFNHAIRKITSDGIVSTVAGGGGLLGYADGIGTAARFFTPKGIAIDKVGNLYVADSRNDVIRKIAPDGRVTTFAGAVGQFGVRDGKGSDAMFQSPSTIAVDPDGNIYVGPDGAVASDYSANYPGILRRIAPDGTVTTPRATFEDLATVSYPGATGYGTGFAITPEGQFYLFRGGVLETGRANAAPAKLINFSARAKIGGSSAPIVAGFVVQGGAKTTLLRGIGPGLAQFNIGGTAAQLALNSYQGNTLVATNSSWSTSPDAGRFSAVFSQVGAFSLDAGSRDAAMLTMTPSGSATALVGPVNNSSGVALAEIYDADSAASDSRYINMSARASVGAGTSTVIAGFSVNGDASKTLLLRAAGPALAGFGVTDAARNTRLELYAGDTLIASNERWSTDGFAAQMPAAAANVGAFPFASGSGDSALLLELRPGTYTLQITSPDNTPATVLAEVYEVPVR